MRSERVARRELEKALNPSETVILIEATSHAKPPKDRIIRVPRRRSVFLGEGKLLSLLTTPILTSSLQ